MLKHSSYIRILRVFLFCALLSVCGTAYAALDVPSAILLNIDTGEVLYEQNADAPIPPASLTKIMTLYIALEKLQSGTCTLQTPVVVSDSAASTGGSRMALLPQETLPLDSLFMGMAVASGNDASHAVAEFVGGSHDAFVDQMNTTATQLGMTGSVFHNPHGLPSKGQVTTARDMARLGLAYVRKYPEAQRYHTTRYMRHNGVVIYNKNPLLGKYEGATGLKTGWIRASGYNIISTACRGNTRLLAVILGASTSKTRAEELYRLFEAGFAASLTGKAGGEAVRTDKDLSHDAPQGAATELVGTGGTPQHKTVAELLPTIDTRGCDFSLNSTIREAYATLAPELKGRIPVRRYHRAYKGARNYAKNRGSRAYSQYQRKARARKKRR